jgi:hypothetical protein
MRLGNSEQFLNRCHASERWNPGNALKPLYSGLRRNDEKEESILVQLVQRFLGVRTYAILHIGSQCQHSAAYAWIALCWCRNSCVPHATSLDASATSDTDQSKSYAQQGICRATAIVRPTSVPAARELLSSKVNVPLGFRSAILAMLVRERQSSQRWTHGGTKAREIQRGDAVILCAAIHPP